jgi:hypothetical protein
MKALHTAIDAGWTSLRDYTMQKSHDLCRKCRWAFNAFLMDEAD